MGKFDLLAENRMGANNNIDRPVRYAFFCLFENLRLDKAGKLLDPQTCAFKTLDKILVMLARQQGCRHDHGHLHPVHGRHIGRPNGNLRFTKADIAANQTVHRMVFGQIIKNRINRIFWSSVS